MFSSQEKSNYKAYLTLSQTNTHSKFGPITPVYNNTNFLPLQNLFNIMYYRLMFDAKMDYLISEKRCTKLKRWNQ